MSVCCKLQTYFMANPCKHLSEGCPGGLGPTGVCTFSCLKCTLKMTLHGHWFFWKKGTFCWKLYKIIIVWLKIIKKLYVLWNQPSWYADDLHINFVNYSYLILGPLWMLQHQPDVMFNSAPNNCSNEKAANSPIFESSRFVRRKWLPWYWFLSRK